MKENDSKHIFTKSKVFLKKKKSLIHLQTSSNTDHERMIKGTCGHSKEWKRG